MIRAENKFPVACGENCGLLGQTFVVAFDGSNPDATETPKKVLAELAQAL